MSYSILDGVKLPEGIKELDSDGLRLLCEEVRSFIIVTALKNGGHLASSLGTVELTVALLRVFDAAKDRILFDVGHQCYAYKILTDRKDKFSTLRLHGGISGFPRPKESSFDKLVAGHGGTALAEAIGYGIADRLNNVFHNNISVLGDGVLANGNTLEAFNNLDQSGKQIIIINDNDYAISPSSGVISSYLKTLNTPFSGNTIAKTFPLFGDIVDYIGCVDGHNLEQLEQAFRLAQENKKTVIVHVKTIKGKGYAPAEQDPISKHSVGGDVGFAEAEGDAILNAAKQNSRVVVITAAMSVGNGLEEFRSCFPDRFFDVGIAEGFAVSLACGLARAGYRPIVAIYSTFFQRAIDQIIIEAADLPIVFCAARAGIVGGDGETHQGIYSYPTFSSAPSIALCYPSGENEYQKMLEWSLNQNGLCAIMLPKLYYQYPVENQDFPMWDVVRIQQNPDAIIFAVGAESLKNALLAADLLSCSDINVQVVNARCPNIFDKRFFDNDCAYYTIEEGVPQNGFAAFMALHHTVKQYFGVKPPILHAALPELLFEQGLSAGKLYAAIKADFLPEDET